MSSSLLVIHPSRPNTPSLEIDWHPTLAQALAAKQSPSHEVIAISVDNLESFELEKYFKNHTSGAPILLVEAGPTTPTDSIIRAYNRRPVHKILSTFHNAQFEQELIEALEKSHFKQQNKQLETLIDEQNLKLKSLSVELEERVEKRQKYLIEARRKNFLTNERIEGLRQALFVIHQATTVAEMERMLNEVLAPIYQLTWTRIIFQPMDAQFTKQPQIVESFSAYSSTLYRAHEKIGSIFFLRSTGSSFLKEETQFLDQIAEAVSFAIERLQKLEQAEEIKEHWEATFNAIADPVSIIDQNYQIVQVNTAFAKASGQEPSGLIGKICYKTFFKRTNPCVNCKLGEQFRIEGQKKDHTYQVHSQTLNLAEQNQVLNVNLYRDITEKMRMERQILESAKMAELGTIGSSIAHELNNPLGGILSFVQLIKSDLKPDDPHLADILEMESGVNRCRDIVQNLLGFTRNPDVDEITDVKLKDVVDRAVKIVELQTKSIGIEVRVQDHSQNFKLRGHLNLLAQGLKNIFQNSIDSIAERIEKEGPCKGIIEIHINASSGAQFEILVLDNGLGIDPKIIDKVTQPLFTTKNPNFHPGLGLAVSSQIFADIGAKVEMSSQLKQLTRVRISNSSIEQNNS